MIEILDLIKRLRLNHSIRNIYKETGVHRTIIRNIRDKVLEKGFLNNDNPIPTEEELLKIFKIPKVKKKHILDPYLEEIKRYVDNKYSYIVIHNLIKDRARVSCSTVRRYILKQFPKTPKPVMIRDKEKGTMEVDFGYLGIFYDIETNKNRKAWVFSGRLCYSRKAYREVVFNQKNDTFLNCHINAFVFFNAVPKKVVPDNTKSAVIKAHFYDPVINRSYRELAGHYGFLISPCLPGRPEHKGGVENDIKYIKNNFLPVFIEQERQKGFLIPRSMNIQESLDAWNETTSEARMIQGVGRTPRQLFEEEKEMLNTLPEEQWDKVVWKKCNVHKTWIINFDNAYYSVPYRLIGKTVDVCGNSKLVRVFFENNLVAVHEKALKNWEFKRKDEHAPPFQEQYLNNNRKYILAQARFIGESAVKVIEKILSEKTVDGTRPCMGILSLSKKYSAERVEKACSRALYYDTVRYMSIKNILEKNLDFLPEEQPATHTGQLEFIFAREKEYFKEILNGGINE
ncbi:IS21 family transposase [Candidatus Woesearchaeota archaeon]|nr:IS21 family transposase [Candidatus Woesearchaeota archaeon]